MHLSGPRLPLSEAEGAAIDRLVEKHPDTSATLMRRDPGETGPVLVHIGDDTWTVDSAGKTRKAASQVASQLYPKGAAHLLGLSTKVDLVADNIKILFYAGSFSSGHEFVGDLTGGSIIARSGNLAGKTVTSGVFDANDLTITSVSGSAFTHVILYKDTGSDATSVLVAVFDVTSFTPTGGDVNVVFNAAGLFSIAQTMAFDPHKNFAYSTVATAPSPATSGLSLTVATGGGTLFPDTPFNVTVWPVGQLPLGSNAEVIRVTAIVGDVFTIARAQEGSTARTIGVGDQIAATITVKTLTDVEAAADVKWTILANGDPGSPELVFADGDVIVVEV